jgi:hypothetical protein
MKRCVVNKRSLCPPTRSTRIAKHWLIRGAISPKRCASNSTVIARSLLAHISLSLCIFLKIQKKPRRKKVPNTKLKNLFDQKKKFLNSFFENMGFVLQTMIFSI